MNDPGDEICVLHVDDEPDLATMVATFLEREDDRITVRTATSAGEGLDLLADHDVDCIVSDYDMPGQSGVEFLESVRGEYPDLPFILYTGKGSEEVASDAVSAGVTDYLQKGFGTEQYELLANRVANAVTEYRTRRFERVAMHDPLRLLNRIFDGFLALDTEWRFTYVNEKAEQIFDTPAAELLGENIWEVFPEATETPFYDHYHEVMRTSEPRTIEEYFEPWDRWYREHLYPSENGLSVLFRDVTEEKEREQEQQTTIDFLQSLYDIATDKTLDANEKVTRLLEVGSEKLALQSGCLTRIEVTDEIHETGTQRVIEASGNHELLRPGNSCPLSQSYCRKTIAADGVVTMHDAIAADWEGDPAYELFKLGCYVGTKVTVDDELYGTVFFGSESPREEPFTDSERTFVRLMSQLVSYELERDNARRELEGRNERLEEFASIVSHDLRTPLTVAEGRLELGREECDNEHFERVARAHERMSVLIDELLTLAREGDEATNLERIRLSDCIEACWRIVETADATLVTDTNRTLVADRSQLQQLLENLFRNAVEHGGEDVTVTIGELANGFYVEDDGSGIPEDERDEIFDARYSTSQEGTGFGLSIVERIVDAHGWGVHVTESADGGARFEITGVEFAE
jgi:PAS domain S-box-containing protein